MGSVTSPETVRRSPVAGCDAPTDGEPAKTTRKTARSMATARFLVHLHNYSSLSLYFLNWLIKDKGLPG